MNDLLFYALLAALLYYFFIYLPSQKKNISNSHPTKLTHSQFTQTDPDPITTIKFPSNQTIPDPEAMKKLEKDIQQKEQTIIGLNNSYEKLETKKNQEITDLKNTLKDKDQKIKELLEVEKQVENLTKNIQDFQKELN